VCSSRSESTKRGTIDDILSSFENIKPKGEYVIVVSGTK
jgi:16S rRNA C1402 (ribose-2'-O) methylase RsmI